MLDPLLEPSDLGIHRSPPGTVLLEQNCLPPNRLLLTRAQPLQLRNALVEGDAVLGQRVYHGSTLRDFGHGRKCIAGDRLNAYA